MDTSFYLGIGIGAVLGFLLSLAANEVTRRLHDRREKAALKEKYAGIVGSYVAFALDSETINYDDPRGDCRIDYVSGHVLKLTYKERQHEHVWEADICMSAPFAGAMVWRYNRLFGKEPIPNHRFGFKRCAVFHRPGRNGESRTYFYLIGEDGFGKEAFEKA